MIPHPASRTEIRDSETSFFLLQLYLSRQISTRQSNVTHRALTTPVLLVRFVIIVVVRNRQIPAAEAFQDELLHRVNVGSKGGVIPATSSARRKESGYTNPTRKSPSAK